MLHTLRFEVVASFLNSSLDSKKSNCFYTGPGDELASAGARTRVRRMGKRSRLDRHPPSGLLFSYSLDNESITQLVIVSDIW
jgi:hypothetical protein